MRSNDIKILKIKPIKQSVFKEQKNNKQDFLLNENSHFFKNNNFLTCFSTQKQVVNQSNVSNSLMQSRNITSNLDNPDALNILHKQLENLKQEKTSFYQRLNKVKTTFDRKLSLNSDEYWHEQPVITKNINLTNFNNKSDNAALKAQARLIAQKIIRNDQQKLPTNFSANKLSLKKDVFFTQSYNKLPTQRTTINEEVGAKFPVQQSELEAKLDQEQNFTGKQKDIKIPEKEISLVIPVDQSKQFVNETNKMEWDITKRPNLGVEQTTNKYYYEEVENFAQKRQIQPKEIVRAIELESLDSTYHIDNFYNMLFNANGTENLQKEIETVKIKLKRGKKPKHLNPNDVELKNKTRINPAQVTTMFNNKYQIQHLSNGRQRIIKIKKTT